jgi:cell division protein FtsW
MLNRKTLFASPASAYYLILGSISILSALGLVMVLSASSVQALTESGNSFAVVFRQAIFLGISIFLAWLAVNLKERLWLLQARFALVISIFFLVLPQMPGVGKEVGGNRNWIEFGSFSIQPSEFAKFGLIMWCALMLKRNDLQIERTGINNPVPKLLPGILLVMGFILIGRDLGTATVVAGIVCGILFISGINMRHLATLLGLVAIGAIALIATNQTRLSRFAAFSDPFSEENFKSAGWQQAHSLMGLASGGIFGSGLGSGKQKWGNLPAAHTDFIFSVIGEELGLLGALVVLFLFAILILAIFRVAIRAENSFDRYVIAGIGSWITIQVLMNVGSVISVLPVVGVTLPFISYGGSSLIATFVAIGYVLGVLKRDPEIAREIAERKSAKIARG